jgi:hypothetical protein
MTEPVRVMSVERRAAWEIAAYARRFSLLARRPELACDDRRVRSFHALAEDAPGGLHLFDAASVIGASDADLACARVVAVLGRGAHPSRQLLEVLDAFAFDRLAAVYFALPSRARRHLRGLASWAARAEELADAVMASARAIEDLVDETPTTSLGHELARASLVG